MNLNDLKLPFPETEIEWRVGSTNKEKTRGAALAYLTNRAIMNRLDDVCGPENWKNEFAIWKSNGQLCGISVKIAGEWVTKWDGADDTSFESLKGGLSDSMKRAAVQWGIGRYLYYLDTEWVELKNEGRSLVTHPALPKWALPLDDQNDRTVATMSMADIMAYTFTNSKGQMFKAQMMYDAKAQGRRWLLGMLDTDIYSAKDKAVARRLLECTEDQA